MAWLFLGSGSVGASECWVPDTELKTVMRCLELQTIEDVKRWLPQPIQSTFPVDPRVLNCIDKVALHST